MKNKPILVTGGCGFVGRHLVRALLDKGEKIWIVDNLFTGKHPDTWLTKAEMKKVTFVQANALQFFSDIIEKKSKLKVPAFSDVYHLASIVGGRSLIDGDPLMVSYDLAIDSMLFTWATRSKGVLERLLYASSSAAYPIHLQSEEKALALKEEYIQFNEKLGQPDMTYGWSKLTGEFLARLAHSKYGLHVACVRPFSGYGEDQDLTYPTPSIALRVARHDSPIEVWGTGEQGRDFVHIDDCVDAMMIILDKVKDGRGINIGSGTLTSFNELIALFCDIEGHTAEIKRLIDKPVGVQSRYADTTILNKEIKWKPKISLRKGMTRVLEYAHKRLKDKNLK